MPCSNGRQNHSRLTPPAFRPSRRGTFSHQKLVRFILSGRSVWFQPPQLPSPQGTAQGHSRLIQADGWSGFRPGPAGKRLLQTHEPPAHEEKEIFISISLKTQSTSFLKGLQTLIPGLLQSVMPHLATS